MTPAKDPLLLIVDDDASVRRVLRVGLEREGFRVLVAEHGLDGLAQLQAASEPVRLVITDVVMPEMGGVAFAERALERVPAPRVILMSGFSHDPARLSVRGQTPPFVQKPFKIDEVAKLIRLELGQAR